MTKLHITQRGCASLKATAPGQNLDCTRFIELCEETVQYCRSVGFDHSAKKAFGLMTFLKKMPSQFDASAVEAEFRSLEGDITVEIFNHKFIQVEKDVARYFDKDDLFGSEVSAAFPHATFDIKEAGNCMAVGADTAAVFHLMRVVEWGLRAFAKRLGLTQVGKAKPIPLEYAQWEKILNQLPEKIEAKISTMHRGPQKQKAQEFYYSSLHEMAGFKDAWRNHIMHVRRRYSSKDALAIYSHVERFMNSLAEFGIRDAQ